MCANLCGYLASIILLRNSLLQDSRIEEEDDFEPMKRVNFHSLQKSIFDWYIGHLTNLIHRVNIKSIMQKNVQDVIILTLIYDIHSWDKSQTLPAPSPGQTFYRMTRRGMLSTQSTTIQSLVTLQYTVHASQLQTCVRVSTCKHWAFMLHST